jgi:multidrug efflux pump subunit AcrB
MAYALMGGIIVGTLLTLVFLPALYVAWFRVEAPSSPKNEAL